MSGNDIRVVPGNYHGVVTSGGVASQSLNGGPGNMSFYSTPSPMAAQISGRLFSDSGPRRSTQLAAETAASTNSNATTVTGNGTSHSSKYIGGSKLSSVTFRSVTVRKGQPWTSESFDEGILHEVRDDSRSNAATSSSSPAGDLSSHDQEETAMPMGGVVMSSSRVITGTSEILDLLRALGEGYRLSCMYRCQDALDAYLKLPHKHYNTGWVLSQVGKSYFELVDYQEAHRAFSLARLASPYSLEGMDIHSTVLYEKLFDYITESTSLSRTALVEIIRGLADAALMDGMNSGLLSNEMDRVSSPRAGFRGFLKHLKEDMKLSYLAQELISTDRLAPQSCVGQNSICEADCIIKCAMGNCYSLQEDHETALKNFQRAVRLNSRFAYAHTLCGHEYVALEDFENGIKSYHSALRIDGRHYNAWYGLGMIYLRQEKFEFSEHHFHMAFQINPRSSVIMSYLGTAFLALKVCAFLLDRGSPVPKRKFYLLRLSEFGSLYIWQKNDEAFEMMEKAILADKKNPLPLYQKANILVSIEKFDEALKVVEELKEYAPQESSVYALMGKIYRRSNMYDKAMLHFGLALDLKPPATDVATIKAAIEKLHVPDELEDAL
ncbi:hypothetical protein RHGRI_011534 [Rhododendron griersonianum]|nr:hypothetical protein RHGRI_011534 [Rhododendron griersonianum]KAG5553671.1 hypothetical protein RHGRI_011534 [Rhododendron griersonianum]